jgi:hypothetical protein
MYFSLKNSFEANRSNDNINEKALQMPITYVLVTNEDEFGATNQSIDWTNFAEITMAF